MQRVIVPFEGHQFDAEDVASDKSATKFVDRCKKQLFQQDEPKTREAKLKQVYELCVAALKKAPEPKEEPQAETEQ